MIESIQKNSTKIYFCVSLVATGSLIVISFIIGYVPLPDSLIGPYLLSMIILIPMLAIMGVVLFLFVKKDIYVILGFLIAVAMVSWVLYGLAHFNINGFMSWG